MQQLNGCSWWEPDDISDESMFIPEMAPDAKFDPFFLSIWDYYGLPQGTDPYTDRTAEPSGMNIDSLNSSEWQRYLGVSNGEFPIDSVLYVVTEASIDTLISLSQGKTPLVRAYRAATGKGEWTPAFQYLKKSKQLSKALRIGEYYWGEFNADTTKLRGLKLDFLEGYRKVPQAFLRTRYAFQYVRTCRAVGDYAEATDFVKKQLKLDASKDGSMFYRIRAAMAGCLYMQGQFAESNLEFARLYELGDPYRYPAFQSFHPQHEVEWNQTLKLAANAHERVVLWHLLGVYADPLRGMKEIIKLEPQSEYLPLLLTRAVQIAESHRINNPRYNNDELFQMDPEWASDTNFTIDPLFSWKKLKGDDFLELLQVTESTAKIRKADQPLWFLAAAYLHWINNNPNSAAQWIADALRLQAPRAVNNQIRILELLVELQRSGAQLDAAAEARILERIQALPNNETRAENSLRYTLRFISNVYRAKGDSVWAELAFPLPDAYFSTTPDVQPFIDLYLHREAQSPFRRFLIDRYPLKLYDLYDIQATQAIYRLDFKEAQAIYAKDPQAGTQGLFGNPFNHRIVDCHDCDHLMKKTVTYTKRSFVDKMLAIAADIENNPDSKARAFSAFTYASGLYNMTWYGNARVVHSTAVSMDYFDSNRFSYWDDADKPATGSYYDCLPAQKYYLMALEGSRDKEFQAKCVWMAAKCEHNHWLETEYQARGEDAFRSGEYFRKLRNEFADTRYYQSVLSECGYFCQFIQGPGRPDCIRNK
jgi:hypothetical protein